MRKSVPEIQVDELMHSIRKEVGRQKGYLQNPGAVLSSVEGATDSLPLELPRLEEPFIEPGHKKVWHVNDFLQYHDRQFVDMAYRFILKRHCDGAGAQHYLNGLREGVFNKVEIIARLRYSPEGRAGKVSIKGLLFSLSVELLGKVPVIGFMVRWCIALVRLPVFVKHFKTLEELNRIREQRLYRQMDQWADLLEAASANTVTCGVFDRAQARISAQISQLSIKLEHIAQGDPAQGDPIHTLDEMYTSFEDRFRGSREDIKARQRIYLEWIDRAGAGVGEAPVIDLGFGRGEWLELLEENQKTAIGVDLNKVFVSRCLEDGFNVVEADALVYLRNLDTASSGAITAFHLIEHLPLKILVDLMSEALRVLKPGGIVLFETPNPENLTVGACNFYIDPTHRNPLPPETTRYLLEAQGFVNCEILRLHPVDEILRAKDIVEAGLPSLVHLLYGEQDYAIIAQKENP